MFPYKFFIVSIALVRGNSNTVVFFLVCTPDKANLEKINLTGGPEVLIRPLQAF